MKKEIKNWLEKSKKDLETAKRSIISGDYEWACFQFQQSIEKALKAFYIKKYQKLLKVHDLVLLAKKVDAPENIIKLCKEIAPAYIYTRYPDSSVVKNLEELANKFSEDTEKVLKWIENQLN